MSAKSFTPQEVLDFWFPGDSIAASAEAHSAFWFSRMQGGLDDAIIADFPDLTLAAARGELDDWAETPLGRLALILVLDQFPRSLWRDTPAAFGQDIKTTGIVLEGIRNGHYQALDRPWQRTFYIIALGHCEGPDHLARFELIESLIPEVEEMAAGLVPDAVGMLTEQTKRVRGIIEAFGRHPHRNSILGRISTPAEETYIAAGDFPHVAKTPKTTA